MSLVPLEGLWFSSKQRRIAHQGFVVSSCVLVLNELTLKPNIFLSSEYEARGKQDEFRHRTTRDTLKPSRELREA